MKVLVVHRDEVVQAYLEKALSEEGLGVIATGNFASAAHFLENVQVNALFVEEEFISREFPAELLEATISLKGVANGRPIWFETALSGQRDFSINALIAALPNIAQLSLTLPIEIGPLEIKRSGEVFVDGERKELTSRELSLLISLAIHQGQVLSATRLVSEVWGLQHDPQTNIVAVYIKRIREKLGRPGLLHNVRGMGYVLDPDRG